MKTLILSDSILRHNEVEVSASTSVSEKPVTNLSNGLMHDDWQPTSNPSSVVMEGRMPAGMWIGGADVGVIESGDLIVNGEMNGVVGWGENNSILNSTLGVMTVTSVLPNIFTMTQTINCIIGETYSVEFTITEFALTGSIAVLFSRPNGSFEFVQLVPNGVTGTFSNSFVATVDTLELTIGGTSQALAGEFFSCDDVSVKSDVSVKDLSVNNRNLTIVGSNLSAKSVSKSSQLTSLNGFNNTSYLQLSPGVDLDVGANNFGFFAWVKLSQGSSIRSLIQRQSTGAGSKFLSLFINASGLLTLRIDGVDHTSIQQSRVDDDVWHFVGVARNSSVTKLYVDGAVVYSTNLIVDNLSMPGGALRVGAWNNGFFPLSDGDITLLSFETDSVSDDWVISTYNKEKHLFIVGSKIYNTLISSRATTCDYVAIAGHNLANSISQISIDYSDDDTVWTTASELPMTHSKKPLINRFTQSSHKFWRVSFDGGIIPEISILNLGLSVEIPEGLMTGYNPTGLMTDDSYVSSISATGNFIGRSTIKKPIKLTFNFSYLPVDWVRQILTTVISDISDNSFFIVPQFQSFDDVVYCWTQSGNDLSTSYDEENHNSLRISVDGRLS